MSYLPTFKKLKLQEHFLNRSMINLLNYEQLYYEYRLDMGIFTNFLLKEETVYTYRKKVYITYDFYVIKERMTFFIN